MLNFVLYWLLPLLLFLSLLIHFRTSESKTQKKKRLPPGPPRLPFLGNLHQLGALPHQSLWKLSKRYGGVMFLQLGSIPTVVISSAKAAKQVLKVHDLESCSRLPTTSTRMISYNFLDVGFAPYGDYWREIRKICVLELFSVKRVKSFRSIREEEIASMINAISQSTVSGIPVDLSKTFYSLVASIIFRSAFGMSVGDTDLDGNRLKELVVEAEALLVAFCAADFFPNTGWIFDRLSGFDWKLERYFHKFDNLLQDVIDDHLNRGVASPDQEDIVDVLLKLERNEHGFHSLQLTKDHIKAVLSDVFLAGIDTSAVTMIWAMAELARNPRVMKKAQAEIRSCLSKKGEVSEADIDELEYLKMIVKETLRLHPAAPLLLQRETISHFKVDNYDIHPGTCIQVNVWAIGRDPKSWENPEEFFPERFMTCDIDFKGQSFELLPFGAGRRGCPGINMAICTVGLALASVLYHFDWKLPDGLTEFDIDMEEEFGVVVHKRSPLCLVPVNHRGSS